MYKSTLENKVSPAAAAFLGLMADPDESDRGASRTRKSLIMLMALGMLMIPLTWAGPSMADDADDGVAVTSQKSGSDDDDDDDDDDDEATEDGSTDGESDSGLGGKTDRGGDTSANNADTAGTTAGTGASQTKGDDDTGLGGKTDRGGDTSANNDDTRGTTAGTGASKTQGS